MAATVLLAGCPLTGPDFSEEGTVRFVDVEGGCWVIDTAKERLEPINLPAASRIDGLVVVFEANRRTDLASICQVGILVELERISQQVD